MTACELTERDQQLIGPEEPLPAFCHSRDTAHVPERLGVRRRQGGQPVGIVPCGRSVAQHPVARALDVRPEFPKRCGALRGGEHRDHSVAVLVDVSQRGGVARLEAGDLHEFVPVMRGPAGGQPEHWHSVGGGRRAIK